MSLLNNWFARRCSLFVPQTVRNWTWAFFSSAANNNNRRLAITNAEYVEMNGDRWRYTNDYLREVFGKQDALLDKLEKDSVGAKLPPIAISPEVGRLLSILTSMTAAKTAIELGTLGGYSSVWIARALKSDGKLFTVERNPENADFAEAHFKEMGLSSKIEVVRGGALEVLPSLVAKIGLGKIDVVFIDAQKTEYCQYFKIMRDYIAPGGLIIADNVLGTSSWWIDDETNKQRKGADDFNRLLASDDEFETTAFPLREGVLIAKKKNNPQ